LTTRACEIRLRAERKAGQLLQTIEHADKGRPAKTSGRRSLKPTLSEMGFGSSLFRHGTGLR
jgi:hypothetical protein